MFRLKGTTTIPADAAAVSAYLADPGNETKWQNDIAHMQLVSGTAGQPGAKHERVQGVGGRNIKTEHELVTHEPGSHVSFRDDGKVITYRLDYRLSRQGAGTRVEMEIEGEMKGFASMFEGMASEALEKEIPRNLERLSKAVAA